MLRQLFPIIACLLLASCREPQPGHSFGQHRPEYAPVDTAGWYRHLDADSLRHYLRYESDSLARYYERVWQEHNEGQPGADSSGGKGRPPQFTPPLWAATR